VSLSSPDPLTDHDTASPHWPDGSASDDAPEGIMAIKATRTNAVIAQTAVPLSRAVPMVPPFLK
jgi:hypothetical protein